jgi:Tfp pilus assembly protein PilF
MGAAMTQTSPATAALFQQAIDLHRRGDLAAAEQQYRAVLAREPAHADALHLLGTIRAGLGHEDEGIALIGRALRAFPAMPDAHYNLGNIHRQRGQLADAERHYRQAIALQPAHVNALANLGALVTKFERYDEGERFAREALKHDPNNLDALRNLAALHDLRGQHDATVGAYDAILRRAPGDAETHYMKALALLLRGQLKEGWEEFRWRLQRPQSVGFHKRFPFPYWNGEPLADAGVLVWTERGPGDEILMGTMLPDLMRRAGHVVLIASERMAPLFAAAFPGTTVIAADDKPKDGKLLAGVRYQASFSELGRWLRPDLDSFPCDGGYLTADRDLAARLRTAYLRERPGTRLVGISWRSRNPDLETEKSMTLQDLDPVLAVDGITFVNLQYGDCTDEIAAARARGASIIHDGSIDPLRDLNGFAAQVAAMDLVVSVSNTTVHMAGALGRPTWAMLPENRGRMWYWFLNRSDSPWYRSARLFRRPAAGWHAVISQVAAALAEFRPEVSA